jgi:hypothetical protein
MIVFWLGQPARYRLAQMAQKQPALQAGRKCACANFRPEASLFRRWWLAILINVLIVFGSEPNPGE